MTIQAFLHHSRQCPPYGRRVVRGNLVFDDGVKLVDAYMNRRSATDDGIGGKLDRLARAVEKGNTESFIISHSLYRFIRHQLIYASTLPAPGAEAQALGEKRYQAFLDSVAAMLAKGAANDNAPAKTTKEE